MDIEKLDKILKFQKKQNRRINYIAKEIEKRVKEINDNKLEPSTKYPKNEILESNVIGLITF